MKKLIILMTLSLIIVSPLIYAHGLFSELTGYWYLNETGSGDYYEARQATDYYWDVPAGGDLRPTNTSSGCVNNTCQYFGGLTKVNMSYLFRTNNSEFTWAFWFKSNDTTNGRFIEHTAYCPIGCLRQGYIIEKYDNNILRVYIGEGSLSFTSLTSASLNNYSWYHVAVTFNESLVSLYINGALVNSTSGSFDYNTSSIVATHLGGNGFGTNGYVGFMDEIGFWNTTLSASDVATLASNTSESFYPFGCIIPTYNYTMNDDTWCPGTYYFNSTDVGYVFRPGSNDDINCNGALIVGNGSGIGININGATGVTLKNCNFKNFSNNYAIQGTSINIQINDSISTYPTNTSQTHLYILGNATNVLISNFTAHSNPQSHGMYISASATRMHSIRIINSTFYNNTGAGIQINSATFQVYNLTVAGNHIYNNTGAGIQIFNGDGNSFYNNSIHDNGEPAVYISYDATSDVYSGRNNRIFNNTFYNNSNIYNIFLNNATFNNTFFNNTYYGNNITISHRTQNVSFQFIENTTLPIYITSSEVYPFAINKRILFNWSGLKEFNVTNNSVRWNPISSYNDVQNLSGLYLAANVTNFSLSSGYYVNVLDGGCDTVPTDDYYINRDIIYCPSTYYLDDADNDGSQIINASNIIIDCNGATLQSPVTNNGSAFYNGVYTTIKNNVTIKNCNIKNFQSGLYVRNLINSNFTRNTFNGTYYAIRGRSVNHSSFNYNNFTNTTYLSFYMYEGSMNNTIEYNRLTYISAAGIVLYDTTTYNLIRHNYLYNNTNSGIGFIQTFYGSSHNIIDNNSVSFASWNGIDSAGYNNTIANNTVFTTSHNGLDFCHNYYNGTRTTEYSRFYNNNVSNLADNAIYGCGSTNFIYNNYLNNATGHGILIQGNISECINNSVYNNFIYNSTYGVGDECVNDTYINNSFLEIVYSYAMYLDLFDPDKTQNKTAYFYNNTMINRTMSYRLINANTTLYIIHNNGSANITASSYTGIAFAKLTLIDPYLSVYNHTGSTFLTANVSTYNLTLEPSGVYILMIYSNITNFNMFFYDEDTLNLLTGLLIYAEVIDESFVSGNYTTTTGGILVPNITTGQQKIEYWATNYTNRIYYANLIPNGTNYLNLYLRNTTTTDLINVSNTLYDQYGTLLENYHIKLLRYYLETNSYIQVETCKTDFQGYCKLIGATLDDDFYKFRITNDGGTIFSTSSGSRLYYSTLSHFISTSQTMNDLLGDLNSIVGDVSFLSTSNTTKFEFNSPDGLTVNVTLLLYASKSPRWELINSSTMTASSGTLYIDFTPIAGYTYHAVGYTQFYNDDAKTVIDVDDKSFDSIKETMGLFGLFISGLVIITFVYLGIRSQNPMVALLLIPLGLFLTRLAGFHEIPYVAIVVIFALVGALIYAFSEKA